MYVGRLKPGGDAAASDRPIAPRGRRCLTISPALVGWVGGRRGFEALRSFLELMVRRVATTGPSAVDRRDRPGWRAMARPGGATPWTMKPQ